LKTYNKQQHFQSSSIIPGETGYLTHAGNVLIHILFFLPFFSFLKSFSLPEFQQIGVTASLSEFSRLVFFLFLAWLGLAWLGLASSTVATVQWPAPTGYLFSGRSARVNSTARIAPYDWPNTKCPAAPPQMK
jgi:hypothetical protein